MQIHELDIVKIEVPEDIFFDETLFQHNLFQSLHLLNDLSNLTDSTGQKLATFIGTNAAGFEEWSFNIQDADLAAQKLGISTEFLMQNFQRARDYGIDNNFIASFEEGELRLSELTKKLAQAEEDLNRYTTESGVESNEYGNNLLANQTAVDAKKAEIETLKRDIGETTQNMALMAQQVADDAQAEYNAGLAAIQALSDERKRRLTSDMESGKKSAVVESLEKQMQEIADETGVTLTPTYEIDDEAWQEALEKQRIYEQRLSEASVDNVIKPDFEGDTKAEQAFDSTVEKFQAQANNETIQSALDTLSDYTAEQLKSIQLNDGLWDSEQLIQAEQALDTIKNTLGLTNEETQQLASALQAMGLVTNNLTDISSLRDLQDSGYEGLQNVDLDFNSAEMSIDELSAKLNELKSIYIDAEVNPEASAELDSLIEKTQREYNIRVGYEKLQGTMTPEEFLELSENEQRTVMINCGVNATNFEAFLAYVQGQTIETKVNIAIANGQTADELLGITDDTELAATLNIDVSQVEQARSILEGLEGNQTVTVNVEPNPKQIEVTAKETSVPVTPTPNPMPVPTTTETESTAQGTVNFTTGTSPSTVPDANGVSNFTLGESPETVPDANGISNFELGYSPETVPAASGIANFVLGSYPTQLPSVTQVIKQIVQKGTEASGTMLSPAHAYGTAYNVINYKNAYKDGKVALDKDEEALVNELGMIYAALFGDKHRKIYLTAGKLLESYKLQRRDEIYSCVKVQKL